MLRFRVKQQSIKRIVTLTIISLISDMMQATGPNGQMSAPPINMAMGAPNMMGAPGAYQGGWTSPHQGALIFIYSLSANALIIICV